jgi:type I restriction enzyme, R subunit
MTTRIQLAEQTEAGGSTRAVQLLTLLGWHPIQREGALALREHRPEEVILKNVLIERLDAINSFEYRGERRKFSEESLQTALSALRQNPAEDLVRANEKIWNLLRYGIPVRETVGDDVKSFTIRFIDWDAPENNSFQVAREFYVRSESGSCRFDLVLFVNGLPLVVVEAKASRTDPAPSESLDGTIEQLNTNARKVPQLFHFAQLLIATTTAGAVYGCVAEERINWLRWRELQRAPASIRDIADVPGAGETLLPLANEFDRLIHALCRRRRLLDLIRWFTVFRSGRRILARYYQYFAAQAVMAQVTKPEIDGRRPGGVIWHAQGSGKSLTMTMISQVLLDEFRERNSRIVLLSDRSDLDRQHHFGLVEGGIPSHHANTGSELRALLKDEKVRVVTTLIQKFSTISRAGKLVADSPDIFVLVDEAHRSQFGELYHSMRQALPRACLIGFTGTPDIRAIEGFGTILSKYSFWEAVADRSLLPIRWFTCEVSDRSRAPESWLERSSAKPHEAFDEIVPSLAQHIGYWESPERISATAAHIAEHFKSHFVGTELKGQVVTPSRTAAFRYKKALDEIGGITSAVVMTHHEHDDSELLRDYSNIVRQYGSEVAYESSVIDQFRSNDDPKLLIVVDKYLAGFDVPRNSVLYLTRPLQGPNLLQAISRVNRIYPGKDAGVVVDYVGAIHEARNALGEDIEILEASDNPTLETSRTAETVPPAEAAAPTPFADICTRILAEEVGAAHLPLQGADFEHLAIRIHAAIVARRKVDWVLDCDIPNRMKTAIEDELFRTQSETGIAFDIASIDRILEKCVTEAKQHVP